MSLSEMIRDWWRGYSEADLEEASRIMRERADAPPGGITEVRPGVFRAICHLQMELY